jgi:hypothetical protein
MNDQVQNESNETEEKGVSKLEQMKINATMVIEQSHNEGLDEDATKMKMFAAGVKFSKLNSLYKSISIELGHLVDPKEITESLKELIPTVEWADIESWESGVQQAVDWLVSEVDGATPQRALALVRAYCKEEEVQLPAKPKGATGGGTGGGRASKLAAGIVDLVIANPMATKQEAYDVIYPLVGGKMKHKNAMYYVNSTFAIAVAAASGTTLDVVTANLKEQADPANTDPAQAADEDEDDEGDFE